MNDAFEHFDAAYALGALEPAEAAAFAEHLPSCAACRDRVEQARSTVGLLTGVDASALAGDAPPDTLLPSLLRRAGRERTRRTGVTAAVAALVAACLLGLGVVLWDGLRAPAPAAHADAKPVALVALRPSPVQATAALERRAWGTEIYLHCHYTRAVHGSYPYRLVVIDTAGHADDAGSWQLAPGHDVDYTAGTAVRRDRIAKVQVTLADGTPILQLTP